HPGIQGQVLGAGLADGEQVLIRGQGKGRAGVEVHPAVAAGTARRIGPAVGACQKVGDAVQVHVTGTARGDTESIPFVFAVFDKEQAAVLAGDHIYPAVGSTGTEVEVVPTIGSCDQVGVAVNVHVLSFAYGLPNNGTGLFPLIG